LSHAKHRRIWQDRKNAHADLSLDFLVELRNINPLHCSRELPFSLPDALDQGRLV
jgi:hypothetical protein